MLWGFPTGTTLVAYLCFNKRKIKKNIFTINPCVIYLVLYTLCFRIEFSIFVIENVSSSRMRIID
jgi:hypothetical protein